MQPRFVGARLPRQADTATGESAVDRKTTNASPPNVAPVAGPTPSWTSVWSRTESSP